MNPQDQNPLPQQPPVNPGQAPSPPQQPGLPQPEFQAPQQPTVVTPTPVQPQPQPPAPQQPVQPLQPSMGQVPQPQAVPQPPQSPMGQPQQFGPQPQQPYEAPAGNRFKQLLSLKKIRLAITGIIAFIIIGSVILAVIPNLQRIELKTYDADNFSILVPEGYLDTPEASGMSFYENTTDDATQSSLSVSVENYADDKITKEQEDLVISLAEGLLKTRIEEALNGNELSNYKTEKTTFKGDKALVITADVKKDGKNAGKLKTVFAVSETRGIYIMALAHASDKAFTKNIDKMIDSFQAK